MIELEKHMSGSDLFKNKMILLIFKLFIVFVFLFLMDILLGEILHNMYFNVKSGRYKKLTYVLNETNQDILIFGSSHAECHLIPKIFFDSTKLSCYNAGFRGQYLIFLDAIHKVILARYSPKIVIINIDPGMFDASEKDYNYQVEKLSELRPYNRDIPIIKNILREQDRLEGLKQVSNCYCYNSVAIYMIKYLFSTNDNFVEGYYSLSGTIHGIELQNGSNENKQEKNSKLDNNLRLVSQFYEIVNNFRMKGVLVVAVISPTLDEIQQRDSSIISVLNRKGIFTLDYRSNPLFSNDTSQFFDTHHLNEFGAKRFSFMVVNDLMRLFREQKGINN